MKEIRFSQLDINPYTAIGEDWMLVTAGNEERGYNTMTASWGHLGSIWGHGEDGATSVIYVRPQRHTKQFVDREEFYTLSFYPKQYRKELAYLGTKSGRDEDKVAAVGFTPVFDGEWTYFAEASLVLVCRKLYQAPLLEEGFVNKAVLEDCYPQRDLHDMYIGRIEKVLVKE